MPASRNREGGVYALTVFTAIRHGKEEEVRAVIEGLPRGAESPLARLTMLHTSRLQIFDRLVYQGAPQKRDELKNAYLVFTAAFDGELDAFLDALAAMCPAEAESWWRHCVGYPGLGDRAAFKRWIAHNQLHTSLFAVASHHRTVAQVQEALRQRERIVEFAIDAQTMDAESLHARFKETFVEAR